jgi:seryl-tRNA synthetase
MNLKELLGEELYNQLMEKLGDKHKVAIISDGNWIPKEKFDNLNEEKKQYKTQVDDLNRQLGELQGKLKDNEDANQTIEDLKKQIQDKETELASTRKANAVKLEVLKADPNDVADIIPHLKDDAITMGEDGVITGLEEQLKGLKEKKPYLFKTEEPDGTGGAKGGGAKDKGNQVKNPWAKDTFNLTEQGRILKEDPELAKTLMAQA